MINLGIIEIFRELKKTPCSPDPFNCLECPSGGIRLNKHLCWNILLINSPDHLKKKKKHQTGFFFKSPCYIEVEVFFCSADRHYDSDLSPSVTEALRHTSLCRAAAERPLEAKEMSNVIRIRVVLAASSMRLRTCPFITADLFFFWRKSD